MQRTQKVKRLSAIGLLALTTTVGGTWIGAGEAFASDLLPGLVGQTVPGADSLLNAQALPPQSAQLVDGITNVMLNSQPLPPTGDLQSVIGSGGQVFNQGQQSRRFLLGGRR